MSLRQALNIFARSEPVTIVLPKTTATSEANERLAKIFGEVRTRRPPTEDLDDFSWRMTYLLKETIRSTAAISSARPGAFGHRHSR